MGTILIEHYASTDEYALGADIDSVTRLYSELRPDIVAQPGGHDMLLDEVFADGQGLLLVRDDDSEIIGLASYYYPEGKDYMFLSGIVVTPELRGQGEVGPLLLMELARLAIERSRLAIECVTLPEARSFYERYGAIEVGDGDSDRLRVEI